MFFISLLKHEQILIHREGYPDDKINLYNSRIEDYENYLNTFKKPNLSIHEVLQNQNKYPFNNYNIIISSE